MHDIYSMLRGEKDLDFRTMFLCVYNVSLSFKQGI